MHFYAIQDGRISLSGKDIQALPVNVLRMSICMMLLDSWISLGIVAESIAYGKPESVWMKSSMRLKQFTAISHPDAVG